MSSPHPCPQAPGDVARPIHDLEVLVFALDAERWPMLRVHLDPALCGPEPLDGAPRALRLAALAALVRADARSPSLPREDARLLGWRPPALAWRSAVRASDPRSEGRPKPSTRRSREPMDPAR